MRDVRTYLYDIERACALVKRFTSGRSFEDYLADDMLRAAVERQFEIIGEALGQALKLNPVLAERISDSARIVAFRNRLIHAYASVSPEVVWGVVESDLPKLHSQVTGLLGEDCV
jgi:uncharacterized protein with HEPN domain